ncbi:TolC family protein [Chitinophaga pendula]|uniref:TolC family protein n=1 Tax=Chitinophaga TaxID=79328 RepID=UPI000BAE6FF9|nr:MULTISPECIES: TolC family protein [Chitinophaga]ASZ13162.1 transporter [Chitinophaga sp. MD30]UCJ09213.1 TolC family protein [Chitinophaga pendula]
MIRFYFLFIACQLLAGSITFAQVYQPATAATVFTTEDLEDLLMAHHPVVKQTQLLGAAARAQVAQALGKFDPTIYAAFQNKHFGNTNYYNEWNSELKVPLWLAGADLKVAYDRNVGAYANPKTVTNDAGLSAVGLSIPLGQGFFIDNRRNTLWQAKAMLNYAEAEQIKQINTIWLQAISDYWNWYYAYRQYRLLYEGVDLAQTRFQAIREQVLLGDKPAIDSVEAAITIQERKMELAKYEITLQNMRLLLSNHLWNERQLPVELPGNAIPDTVDHAKLLPEKKVLEKLLDQVPQIHPELLKLESKGQQLLIEERYRKEMLKPKLNVTGTLISSRNRFNEFIPAAYDFNWSNYKVGVDFVFPIFLRAERGKLKEVRIKQEQLRYDQLITDRNIRNDVTMKYNDLTAYSEQIRLQVKNIADQEVLLRGEVQKFNLGETTLFLINSRESKLIDMQIKRENLVISYQKALAELYYKAGTRL